MARKSRKREEETPAPAPAAPKPMGLVDGIPDRSDNPSPWKTAVLVAIFMAWVAFLLLALVLGRP